MPIYDFRCGEGHVTEARRGIGTDAIPCLCGRKAKRLFSAPAIKVDGGVSIPASEGYYQNEANGRQLKKKGWDGDRAIEHLRQNRVETETGWGIDMRKANASH